MVSEIRKSSLKKALEILEQGNVTPYAGGTDLMVKASEDATYLFLDQISEMREIKKDGSDIRIGGACTFTELIEHPLVPAILKDAASQVAAPAIRNLGTIGGNICNGSPKADGALALVAADSKLRLAKNTGERVIPIRDFYLGRNQTVLEQDELLVEILMPASGLDHYYFKKVGAREAMAISRVSFAGIMDFQNGRIAALSTSFGAVSDVIINRPDIDAMMIEKTMEEAKNIKEDYLTAYNQAIVPIEGRISAEYRKTVCMNLLRDFLEVNGI